jgi:hypothetical protein
VIKRHFVQWNPRPSSPRNGNLNRASRRSSGPHYMQPTTASVQKKGSSQRTSPSTNSTTTPSPPRAPRQSPPPKFQVTRQVRAVKPVQSHLNGNGIINGLSHRNRNKTARQPAAPAPSPAAGAAPARTSAAQGLDDSLWLKLRAQSEQPVPIPRINGGGCGQMTAPVMPPQTNGQEVVSIRPGMVNGSTSGSLSDSSDSSPMASDV